MAENTMKDVAERVHGHLTLLGVKWEAVDGTEFPPDLEDVLVTLTQMQDEMIRDEATLATFGGVLAYRSDESGLLEFYVMAGAIPMGT